MNPNPLHLTNLNPQFFREVKGRLKPRNIVLTIGASLLTQLAILFYFWASLPRTPKSYSPYCKTLQGEKYGGECIVDALDNVAIDWHTWWNAMFQMLSWTLPFVLLAAGVYLLIGDLAKEERRGTLNFIRLSPQTSQNILLGKLLGVPLLPFLAIAVAIPFHCWTALQAGVSSAEVVSIYLVAIAACCFIYTGAIFYAFLGGAQSWLGVMVLGMAYILLWQIGMSLQYTTKEPEFLGPRKWYFVHISQSLSLSVTFAVASFAVGAFWFWQAINRRFRNPNLTLISKRQSYWITLCVQIFILGFALREESDALNRAFDLMGLLTINLFWFSVLIAALTPHRQTLLDWARYRQDGDAQTRKQRRRSLIKELIWGDKSPALVAIALNLCIPTVVFSPWILSWNIPQQQTTAYLSLLFNILFLLICAAIAQSILLMKLPKRSIVAIGVLLALTVIPPIMMSMIGLVQNGENAAIVWLFSAFSFAAIGSASQTAIFFSFLAQLSIFILLTARLTRQLRRAGESELKALLASRPA